MRTKRTEKSTNPPPRHDWRTSDEDEIHKRVLRAKEEKFEIGNLDPLHPVYSNYEVRSGSGLRYMVEIRDLAGRKFSCDCIDFRTNRLGTCKHVEAVLLQLQSRSKRQFKEAQRGGSTRIDVQPDVDSGTLRVVLNENKLLPQSLRSWFKPNGSPNHADAALEETLEALSQLRKRLPALRISQEVVPWMESRRRIAEARELRRIYELKVQAGEWPQQETTVPLFPYQREGMLHLAFTERALLADEMGLGKTIQAIAASALLHRLGKARRVLVVTPASLKTEWEEQIRRFTALPLQIVFGNRRQRLGAYAHGQAAELRQPFFTIVNYEQMVGDSLEVNELLQPDIVILDEAQRIKNWSTKTAQSVKRLKSRYAFVLTGTPIENRIDDLYSLMDFLQPAVLGPLFAFNREFYLLDEKGRPEGIRNLDKLHSKIAPYMLRRRKAGVETELPKRTDKNFFVPLSTAQKRDYSSHEHEVLKLVSIAQKRPLTQQQQDKLQRELAMMRMLCDTTYILDSKDRTCPKLVELEKILDDCRENDAKLIVFSEWERMLELVRNLCKQMGIGFAWHTGSVPQKRRRAEINAFKEDPLCRAFLSTDCGATGMNLQVASVVVNCDLPWNPAKLEQRIARAWRKHQTRPVTAINLISENSIEHRMLATLATKQTVAGSILDSPGEIKEIKIRGAQQGFLARLQQLVSAPAGEVREQTAAPRKTPSDPALAFGQAAAVQFGPALVRCEEIFPEDGSESLILLVVERDTPSWSEQAANLHRDLYRESAVDAPASSKLEVIDRATNEALQKLIAAGVLTRTSRATRQLMPVDGESSTPVPLSPEEQARRDAYRDQAKRSHSIARVLADAGFENEARTHLLEAILHCARMSAVERRLPEPRDIQDALQSPHSILWGNAITLLREYQADATKSSHPILAMLSEAMSESLPTRAN